LDEGVCIEVGFAKALGKRIVGFKSDIRLALPWGQNPLVAGCIDAWASSLDGVASVLKT
jgi:nucleoside 2-deoxyribosyltransferase